jgi:hypothetical protein
MTIQSLSTLFLGFVLVMASIVIALFSRFLDGRSRITAIGVFIAWLLYVGLMGYTGVIRSATPPGPLFLVVPAALFMILFLTRHPRIRTFARSVPVGWLIGLQSFRVFVEWELHALYQLGLVPRMLTFVGANFDILIGVSAPIIAWLYATGKINARAVRLWSWIGIAMLANVFVRALLSFPGPLHLLHTEVPNKALATFPFDFLPGFLVPLALYLHVLVLRAVPNEA